LADYVHGLGLKFGIHIMRGIPRKAAHEHCPVIGAKETADMIADPSSICIWNPDMYGVRDTEDGQAYYDSLLAMYAEWGVDYIKCDDICDSRLYRTEHFSGWEEMRMLHNAILKCGREIVLSLSPGPAQIDHAWEYCKYANMWRITDDFWDEWNLLKAMFARCEMWQDHVRAGCFPDCDMLPLGTLGKGFGNEWKSRFNREEQKTMMTLWCMFRSPLMIGAELTLLDDWTLSLLTNRELLAFMKDGCVGTQLVRTDKKVIWKNKNTLDGSVSVALFNISDEDMAISVAVAELEEGLPADEDKTLYELWDKQKSASVSGKIEAVVPAHGVKVYRVS
ncbi:MAG: glycoside hydrolase family 27 protein, partial [Butyrivibrio sp.]|nr:glycoside hydrolase family 27 protein [Butyrivibrio sp.]